MLNKQIIDIFELLDDPKANGQIVKAFLQAIDPEASVETYALEGPQGKTDMVKVRIPGTEGKSVGGSYPTIGILGRLGGLGARPEVVGYVSDGDGALAALAVAAKLIDMRKKGDCLKGDVFISTHICPDAPTQPHHPVPFMGSPVEMHQVNEEEVSPELDAILSVDTTKGNRIINTRGFAISQTVKQGYILRASEDLLDIMQRTTGKLPYVFPVNMQDINRNPVYDYNRNSDATETFGSTDVSVDYQHSTHKKDELLTISYRFSHSPNDNKDYTELKNVVNYNPWLGYPQNNINKASTNEHTGQVDYTTPTWKDQTLEVGAKYIFRQSRSNTDRTAFNDSLNIWEDITSKDSHFRHTQHIYSAYLGYSMKFDKFGVKAGVRAEGTALDVKYEMAPDMNFDTHYFDVVPNATVSYQLSMAQQLRLGYNMRIQRPGIWYLNPYVNNADPQNISFGNPNLDSEKSNNINLNYSMFAQKFSINASATYTFVNNSIEQYTFIDPENPGVFQTTYGNIGKKQSTGLFVYANWNPVPLFRIYMNGGMDYTDLKSEKNDMANSGFSGRIFAGTQFNFPLDFRVNIQGGYFSPWIQLQGKGSPFYFTGISVNKDFLKKKLSVQLSFQNPFWKRMKMENTTSDDTFFRREINYRTMRMLMVSVSYRFGTLKDAIKKVKRGISNDDMKSGGSGGGEQQM